jgi:hypothetical protein
MGSEVENTESIDLVLLPVLGCSKKSITVSGLYRDPCACRRTRRAPSHSDVDIMPVTRHREEGFQTGTESVRNRQIHRMISFENIEGSAVRLNAFDRGGDDHVGIGVPVSMRIRA